MVLPPHEQVKAIVVGRREIAFNAVSNYYFATLLAAKFDNNLSAEFLDRGYGQLGQILVSSFLLL